jgi:hypothetical protein
LSPLRSIFLNPHTALGGGEQGGLGLGQGDGLRRGEGPLPLAERATADAGRDGAVAGGGIERIVAGGGSGFRARWVPGQGRADGRVAWSMKGALGAVRGIARRFIKRGMTRGAVALSRVEPGMTRGGRVRPGMTVGAEG